MNTGQETSGAIRSEENAASIICARCGDPIHLGTQRYVCNADGERVHERCATEDEIKAWRS